VAPWPVGVVVGNPRPGSRTLTVATAVADAVARAVGLDAAPREVVDLADLGPALFDRSDGRVADAVARVARCRLVVVASPTYKASYTGLLKSFLDWYSTSGLAGVTAVPVMVGAGPRHALAVDLHLRPVLIEIGATTPSRGLYVLESELDQIDQVIAEWLVEASPLLAATVGARRGYCSERGESG
jgi:FMN reductase